MQSHLSVPAKNESLNLEKNAMLQFSDKSERESASVVQNVFQRPIFMICEAFNNTFEDLLESLVSLWI
jgi:hypothetical protein